MKFMFTSFLLATAVAFTAGVRDVDEGKDGLLLRGSSSVAGEGEGANGVGALTNGVHSTGRKLSTTRNMIVNVVASGISLDGLFESNAEFELRLTCIFPGGPPFFIPQVNSDVFRRQQLIILQSNSGINLFSNQEGPVCGELGIWFATMVETDPIGEDLAFTVIGAGFNPESGTFGGNGEGPARGSYEVRFE